MAEPEQYRIERPWVITTRRVPYGHTDPMGFLYYGNYLLYFEMARGEWMRAAGMTYRAFEESGAIIPVAEAHLRYKGPVRYDDLVEVACAARLEGKTRLKFIYEVRRAGEEGVLTTGWTLHAVVNDRGRPVRVPTSLVELLDRVGRAPEDA